jgi:uncharacterized protein (TIRG00374 family)
MGANGPETQGISLRRGFFSWPTLASFAIAAVILILLITRFPVDLRATWETIRQSDPRLFALAVMVHYATFLFRGLRWRLLLRNAGVGETARLPSLVTAARLVLLGWFASSVTWFRLGDAYRAFAYAEETGAPLARSMGTILAERVMDIALVFLLLLIGFLLVYADPDMQLPQTLLLVGLALVATALLALLGMHLFRRRVSRLLPQRVLGAYRSFHEGTMRSFNTLPWVVLTGLLAWLAEVGRLYFVVSATGLEVGIGLIMFVSLANALLSAVPLSPGGLGIVEAGLVGLLGLAVSRDAAVSITLVDRSISYLSVVLTGVVSLLYHQRVMVRHRSALAPL